MQPFLALLKEGKGVVQLDKDHQCNHLFCREEYAACPSSLMTTADIASTSSIVHWVQKGNDTCPVCRDELADMTLPENGPHLEITGGTPRVMEYYRQLGIPAVNEPLRVRTQEERREEMIGLLGRLMPLMGHRASGGPAL
ncbi:hypothetical protein NMY22_g11562 [Coprinellus aureogranulatus]|nr:hypothetical protein NMY22_g11562 [Coprinellus aureogranulatus]